MTPLGLLSGASGRRERPGAERRRADALLGGAPPGARGAFGGLERMKGTGCVVNFEWFSDFSGFCVVLCTVFGSCGFLFRF